MADFQAGVILIDSSTHAVIWQSQYPNLRIKNLGPEVVYLDRVSPGSGTVSPSTGIPVEVGESLLIPAVDPGSANNVVGANTAGGASRLAVIGVN